MEIFWVVLFVDVIFIGVAYLVNKDNAKYLMACYNTMSKEERKKVDLGNLLNFWKKFFDNSKDLKILEEMPGPQILSEISLGNKKTKIPPKPL